MDFDNLNKSGVQMIPVLDGSSLNDTVARFGYEVEKAVKSADDIVGQFGIGSDGHIAGILPHSSAVSETSSTCGYESGTFTRITLTPPILKQIDVAYSFVSGASKKAAVETCVIVFCL